jgi:DNA-binding winged helix-turn-helix (wHTH) protein/tetratricopeptide (TPR) repeat protein
MTGAREGEAIKAQAAPAARRWSFASAVLDERSLELLIENQPVELEPKPLEVLLHLLRHAGEVVTKDELLEAVWPGRILSDSAITSCVKKLREALRDEQQDLIKTVHGYGYRLVAPVKVEASEAAAPPPHFDFKPGDHPPLRPLWSLVQRLGQGSHGEVWLAQHDKTREPRVYKFAPDGAALHSLKREITLYRLMHDALGDKCPALPVLDWNLEETPYFIETEHASGGSLVGWADSQGGLGQVALAVRLEIAAQCAEALAAAHSVGVLHKDLKPSNVLIVSAPTEPPRIKLCDFGSGGVLDPARLEALGITRLGLTQTLAVHSSGGTPLYLAPEVIAGQPATIQADIYSLGVVLYQLVAGDLKRALAPGWEHDVEDELLREDIAQAAEGHPSRRLADAALLAQRLRTLEQRRAQRASEQMTREEVQHAQRRTEAEAQRARLALERIRGRRVWMRVTMATLATGTIVSLGLLLDAWHARNAANEAAATSKAVSAFLSQDMFAQIGAEQRPLRDLTVKEVLDASAMQVEKRFAGKPAQAAEVHAALGASYLAMDDAAGAAKHLDKALTIFEQQPGGGSESAIATAAQFIDVQFALGKLNQALPRFEAVLSRGEQQLGRRHPGVLLLRQRLGIGHYRLGAWQRAEAELRAVLVEASSSTVRDESFIGSTERMLGNVLFLLANYADAERVLRQAVSRLGQALGDNHLRVALARMSLGAVLTDLGRYREAEVELDSALVAASRWVRAKEMSAHIVGIRREQGRLLLEQNRTAEATALFEGILREMKAWPGPEMDQTVTVRFPLAESYQRSGRLKEAEAQIQLALSAGEKTLGQHHPTSLRTRIALADILRERHRVAEAWKALAGADPAAAGLPPQHPYLANFRRVEGLLWFAQKDYPKAREALLEAHKIFGLRYGSDHWRTRRAATELGRVPSAPVAAAAAKSA